MTTRFTSFLTDSKRPHESSPRIGAWWIFIAALLGTASGLWVWCLMRPAPPALSRLNEQNISIVASKVIREESLRTLETFVISVDGRKYVVVSARNGVAICRHE